MPTTGPFAWLEDEAEERRLLGLSRSLDPVGPAPSGLACREGKTFVDLSSNDYLGLANDARVVAAAIEAARTFGWGSGSSALVRGWSEIHEELAEALARFEHAEAVALFPTGYAANQGTIASLVGPGDAVYQDRLNHSCLVQGARFSGAAQRVYPHCDFEKLAERLERDRGRYRRSLIATDGVFSMDGDLAPLRELVTIAEDFGAMLLVDEAHGTGVFGPDGRGAGSALGVSDRIPVRMGTLSKAIGSIGGFVAGSRRLIDHLINRAATLIYSTALPAAAMAAAREALRIIEEEPERRCRVAGYSRNVREGLRSAGVRVPEGEGPIIPVILGSSDRALAESARLRRAGFLVPAIRPPTVARGTARLRISLSAAHDPEDLARAVELLAHIGAAGDETTPAPG